MSVPGVSMESVEQPDNQIDPAEAAGVAGATEEHDDDALVPTVQVGAQQMVPVSELIKHRKEARAFKKQLADLQPRLERADLIGSQLAEVQPFIEQLRNLTPAQRDAVLSGKVPTPQGVAQPADDVEARELAEDLGLIAQDGSLDIRRARARLDKDNVRFERMLQQAVAPVKAQTHQQQAVAMRAQAKSVKDAAGVPLATPESIDEAYGMLPPELASQSNVAMVVLGVAGLIDRMKGRKVKADAADTFSAPIFSENTGGRRSAPALTSEERATASRLGLTDKDLQNAGSALSQSSGRRGISME